MLISAFDLRARDKLEIHAGAKNKLKSTGVKVPELFMLLGLLLLTTVQHSQESSCHPCTRASVCTRKRARTMRSATSFAFVDSLLVCHNSP